jgi:peptidoglycan/xylan/chitin deacetylase (PgdA/CDA1 family)
MRGTGLEVGREMTAHASPRRSRSFLGASLAVSLVASAIASAGCVADSGTTEVDDDVPSATSEEDLTFRSAATSNVNLRDGELVLTFDDGPAQTSVDVADLLQSRGYTGLFFAVSHHIGSVEAGRATLNDTGATRLGAIAERGQLVANHTHNHCIRGASQAAPCSGRAFADLPAAEMKRQVETTDILIRAALERSRRTTAYLPFFRAPGNSWSSAAATTLSSAALPSNAYGPIAWNLPRAGEEDFQCWRRNETVATCASRYVAAFDAMPSGGQKAVILIHDNFPNAAALTRAILDGLVGRRTKAGSTVRVVRPGCIVGCTR